VGTFGSILRHYYTSIGVRIDTCYQLASSQGLVTLDVWYRKIWYRNIS